MACIQHRRVLLFAFLFTSLTACGGGSSSPAPEVTLDVSTAPAASMVKVDGLDVDECPLRSSEIRVAGETAPAVLNARHEVVMRLPLFYDEEAKWSAPPSGPQDLEVFCKGQPWATVEEAITITELPAAPGTTEAIAANYAQIASDYQALLEQLFPEPGPEQQLFRAMFSAIEELLHGTNPNSLAESLGTFGQTHPDALALLDAVYAIGGADENTDTFSERMEAMSAHAVASAGPKADIEPIPYSDVKLAERMQTYVLLKGLSEDLVHQTREEFGALHELASDFGLEVPLANRINVGLFVLDYFMNTLLVSVFPANLDSIKLSILQTELQNSEVTGSQFVLHASNIPARLSINDLKAMAETLLGAPDVDDAIDPVLDWVDSFEELLPSVAEFAFDTLQSEFAAYASLFPEGVDRDLARFKIVPPLEYTAIGETRELYVLRPGHTEVIRPLDERLEWVASSTHWGSAELYVVPRPAPVDGFWGSFYSGGAFGESQTPSNKIEVTVGEIALVLEQYSTSVPEGGTGAVGVKLSHKPQDAEGPIEVRVRREGDSDISVTSAAPMVFDSSNWSVFRYVTLAAAEDEDKEDGEASFALWTVLDSVGDEPVTLEASFVVTEEDNDRARFVVDPYSVRVPEDGTAEVRVKLSKEPDAPLSAIVKPAGGDADILVLSPTLMRFNENNWNQPQPVTLYARPDVDRVEGKTQFRVSANPPAKVDETFITATEDEPGDILDFRWVIENEYTAAHIVRYTAAGSVAVNLAQSDPLGTGTVSALFEDSSVEPPRISGTATLTVRNHWTNTVCYCGSSDIANCYATSNEEQHALAVDVQFHVGAATSHEIVVIVGKDSPYAVTYDCGGNITSTIGAQLH